MNQRTSVQFVLLAGLTGCATPAGNESTPGDRDTAGGATDTQRSGGPQDAARSLTPAALDSGAAGDETGARDAVAAGSPAGWWDLNWTRRTKVTINDPQLNGDLTNFQVPVRLDVRAIDYKAAKSGGADLRFVAGDGKNAALLHHEVDTWNPGGTSLVWIRLPRLSKGPLVLWLYFGNQNAAAPSHDDLTAVWPAPYAGVWHVSGAVKDSTSNGFDQKEMFGGGFVDAKFGKGLQLNADRREYVALKEDIKIVAGAAGATFSAWIYPTRSDSSDDGTIIMTLGKWFRDNHNSYADFSINAAGLMISHVDPGTNTAAGGYARFRSNPGLVKSSQWVWVTYVIDLARKEEHFYTNGVLVDTQKPDKNDVSAPVFIDMPSSRVVIGTEEDAAYAFYTGTMDELRIEKGMRESSWIAAQYRAMTAAAFVELEPGK